MNIRLDNVDDRVGRDSVFVLELELPSSLTIFTLDLIIPIHPEESPKAYIIIDIREPLIDITDWTLDDYFDLIVHLSNDNLEEFRKKIASNP